MANGPTALDVRAVIGMEPAAVIAYFKAKGLLTSWDWVEVLGEQHTRAFTVAKAMKLDVLQAIQDALAKAIAQGQTVKQFTDEIAPVLQAKGWWGQAIDPETREITPHSSTSSRPAQYGSARRLWTIYQTNLASAFAVGRYQTMMAATETHPYWMYVAIGDKRTRPAHLALSGRVYRYDDPFWSYWYPPNGFRCRCRVVPVSSAMLEQNRWTVRKSGDEPIDVRQIVISSGDTDRTTTQALFKTKTAKGDTITISTDAGFAYNPGASAWQAEAGRWSGQVGEAARGYLH